MDRKYCLYGREKIVQWLTKILETEKRATFKIAKCQKEIPFKKYLRNRFLYSSSLTAKINSKFFIVSANWREKKKAK